MLRGGGRGRAAVSTPRAACSCTADRNLMRAAVPCRVQSGVLALHGHGEAACLLAQPLLEGGSARALPRRDYPARRGRDCCAGQALEPRDQCSPATATMIVRARFWSSALPGNREAGGVLLRLRSCPPRRCGTVPAPGPVAPLSCSPTPPRAHKPPPHPLPTHAFPHTPRPHSRVRGSTSGASGMLSGSEPFSSSSFPIAGERMGMDRCGYGEAEMWCVRANVPALSGPGEEVAVGSLRLQVFVWRMLCGWII